MAPPSFSLTARWVFPLDQPPLAGGVVTISGERIVAVAPAGSADATEDLGNVAVLPGLVNAHTHLDLTGMRGLAPPRLPLPGWLRQVIAHRRQRSPEQVQADIRAGLAECIRTGTTLVGDIAAEGASWDVLATSPIRAVVFRELLGLPITRARQAWESAEQWLAAHPPTATCRPGLSPHAPYSAHRWLYERAAEACREHDMPLMTHLAESADEVALIRERTGPFVEFLSQMGVWSPEGLFDSLGDIVRACRRVPQKLFAHCNYLDPGTLAQTPPVAVAVYCPRTHAAFGHPQPHPFRDFLLTPLAPLGRGAGGVGVLASPSRRYSTTGEGSDPLTPSPSPPPRGRVAPEVLLTPDPSPQGDRVRVALGTDGLASNPDLDLLAELRFLRRLHPELPGDTLLRMATLWGAEALGWGDETGSLEEGKSADLIAVALPSGGDDPYEMLLNAGLPVVRVMCRGRWVEA